MRLREYENGDIEDASKPPELHREHLYYRLVEGKQLPVADPFWLPRFKNLKTKNFIKRESNEKEYI